MTTIGGSEDAVPEFPPGADGSGSLKRQHDASSDSGAASARGNAVPADGAAGPARPTDAVVATLKSTPKELHRLITGQSAEALARPASDGEWGVVEIVPHLRDREEVYLDWIQHLLNEDTPTLGAVDDSLWSIEHDYASENVRDALDRFSESRAEVVETLESLGEEAWQRQAMHPQQGLITLHQLADRMCDHDAGHIEQVRDALA